MNAEPPPNRTAPLALWRVAQAFLVTLHALFGGPEDVARRHTLRAKAHALMAGWLRCAEALMRRLVAIEAAAYPKPNTRPLLHKPRSRVRKLMGFDAEHPEKWRVSLRSFASQRGSVSGCRGSSPDNRQRFRSAWPLAERYEALLRVFNDPAPYAARLARRLHATPHRLTETLRAPREASHRIENFETLDDAVRERWRPHFSSG